MSSTSSIRRVRRFVIMAQLTTRHDQVSSTMAGNKKLAAVDMKVMSAIHSRFGPATWKSHSTRSWEGRCFGTR